MNSRIKHSDIDSELLKKYYSGELSQADRNAIEKIALDDPFLKDAMDGFETVPGSFDAYYSKHETVKSKLSNLFLTVGSLLTIGLVTILVALQEDKKNNNPSVAQQNQTIQADSILTQEVDIIPQAIDTLDLTEESELISHTEIVEARMEIQKTISYPSSVNDVPILIPEEADLEEEYILEPEEHNLSKQELVPATYLFDLFVVDYRRIERGREEITYTKYEFTGTAAEFESEAHEQNAELLEKQVDVPYWTYLDKGMESFANGSYKSALSRYQIILQQYPEDFNALFYGGLCYYNLGSFTKSLDCFDKIIQTDLNAFQEEAKWYKSKCLMKLGRKNEAKILLDEIISAGGFYTKEAINQRKKL